ncbi:hypothetical protein [Streptomyces sediminimaris]|uniref:hypothetical protein n=1 Tax=Streptomyces sediminimaris TaxID=3383721 RepID=UPI00399B08BA
MDIGERSGRLGLAVAVAVAGSVIGLAGCRPMPTQASGGSTRPAATVPVTAHGGRRVPVPAVAAGPGRVRLPAGADGADRAPNSGHDGRGAPGTGTDR